MFTKAELEVIQKLFARKSLTDEDKELASGIMLKLGVEHQREIYDRFVLITGWTNPPKNYPL